MKHFLPFLRKAFPRNQQSGLSATEYGIVLGVLVVAMIATAGALQARGATLYHDSVTVLLSDGPGAGGAGGAIGAGETTAKSPPGLADRIRQGLEAAGRDISELFARGREAAGSEADRLIANMHDLADGLRQVASEAPYAVVAFVDNASLGFADRIVGRPAGDDSKDYSFTFTTKKSLAVEVRAAVGKIDAVVVHENSRVKLTRKADGTYEVEIAGVDELGAGAGLGVDVYPGVGFDADMHRMVVGEKTVTYVFDPTKEGDPSKMALLLANLSAEALVPGAPQESTVILGDNLASMQDLGGEKSEADAEARAWVKLYETNWEGELYTGKRILRTGADYVEAKVTRVTDRTSMSAMLGAHDESQQVTITEYALQPGTDYYHAEVIIEQTSGSGVDIDAMIGAKNLEGTGVSVNSGLQFETNARTTLKTTLTIDGTKAQIDALKAASLQSKSAAEAIHDSASQGLELNYAMDVEQGTTYSAKGVIEAGVIATGKVDQGVSVERSTSTKVSSGRLGAR